MVGFQDGRALSAPTLSALEDKAVWEMDERPLEGEEDSNEEDWMTAKFQEVLNTMWHNRWKGVMKQRAASKEEKKGLMYIEDEWGLLQPVDKEGKVQ